MATSNPRTFTRRSTYLFITTLAFVTLATGREQLAVATPFTAGNIIVGECDTTNGTVAQLWEYTTNGGFIQTILVPSIGPGLHGRVQGNSTTCFQINFDKANNQLLYVSTGYTGDGQPGLTDAMTNMGYVRYNASSGTIDDAHVLLSTNGSGTGTARGVAPFQCQRVLISTSAGQYERLLDTNTNVKRSSINNRYMETTSDQIFMASGATIGTGIYYLVNPFNTADATTNFLFKVGVTNSHSPQGFYPADANTDGTIDTVYMCDINTNGVGINGLHKVVNIGGTWTDLGRPTALATYNATTNASTNNQAYDVDVATNGDVATIYCVSGGNGTGCSGVFQLVDTLSDTNSNNWQGLAITPLITGLITPGPTARTIAIVPPAAAPTFAVDITDVSVGTSIGQGTVVKGPNGGPYAMCSNMTLTATAANTNFIFAGWGGDAGGIVSPLTVEVDRHKTITYKWIPVAGHSLLTLTITGSGTVSESANNFVGPGIFIDPTTTGTTFTMVATPGANYVFDHWSGPVIGGDGSTNFIETILMDANKAVTAVFKQLRRVRAFTTGNGTITINNTPGTGEDVTSNSTVSVTGHFRDGTVISLTANSNAIGTPADLWSFVHFYATDLSVLSTSSTANMPALSGDTDYTARFSEASLNASARAFTPGNIVTGDILEAQVAGAQIELREYNTSGQLVQPPILVPVSGSACGSVDSFTSTTVFQMAFDPLNSNRLYAAASRTLGLLTSPQKSGFVRTQFNGNVFAADLSDGNTSTSEGRGVAVSGKDIYWCSDAGIRHSNLDTPGTIDTIVGSTANSRAVRVFNNALYVSTASGTGVFAANTNIPNPGGPGVFRIDTPLATPTYVQMVATGTGTNPTDFCFASNGTFTHMYIAMVYGSGVSGVVKAYNNGTTYTSLGDMFTFESANTNAGNGGRGVAAVVTTGTAVNIYVMQQRLTSDSHVEVLHDVLGDTNPDNWNFEEPNGGGLSSFPAHSDVIAEITRGKAIAIVPAAACACPGDTNADGKLDGQDVQNYANARTTAHYLVCADMNASGTLTSADDSLFIAALLSGALCP